jgi:HEPN domain-containing protein
MNKRDSADPADWFAKAEGDLVAAEVLRASGADVGDSACYHAQQCAEKYLKGFLKSRAVPFKWVHDLGYLVDLCAGLDPDFSQLRELAVTLTRAAELCRYPGDEAPATDPEIAAAIAACLSIRQMVLRKIGK